MWLLAPAVVAVEAGEAQCSVVVVVARCLVRTRSLAVVGGLARLVAPLVVRCSYFQPGITVPNAFVSTSFDKIATIG